MVDAKPWQFQTESHKKKQRTKEKIDTSNDGCANTLYKIQNVTYLILFLFYYYFILFIFILCSLDDAFVIESQNYDAYDNKYDFYILSNGDFAEKIHK